MAAAIIHSARTRFDARVLFVAHRLELIDQTVRQLARWGITEVGVMRADDERTNALAPVQVATIQTLARRSAPPTDIVFVDEAHRAAGDSYVRIMGLYPEATIIGLTATPCRLDGRPLGDHFDEMVMGGTYAQLIADGFVVEPRVYAPHRPVDLTGVRRVAGDWNEGELAEKMIHVTGDLVAEWRAHAEGRGTVVFACTIAHSEDIVLRFRTEGIRAEHLDGNTPLDERRELLARLDSGALDVISNCGVLTEGWDQPSAKCVVLARPTMSLSLHRQMAGRALRPWEGVTPVILDHASNVDRHGMPHDDVAWSLSSTAARQSEKSPYRTCPRCFGYVLRNPCELCGFEAPVKPREIREERGELVQRTDDRRAFFEKMWALARARAFKPGFAGAKYKEKYGSWPPWSWSQECKAAFEADGDWGARLRNREAEKAAWAEPTEPAAPPESAPPEEDFASWLGTQGVNPWGI